MNAIFFASLLLMLLLAMAFAIAPLIRNAKSGSNGFASVPILAALAALLLAVGLYAVIGRPDIATSAPAPKPSNTAFQSTPASEKTKAASVNTLLVGLEQRLEENPDDADGWLLLAKSYDHLGRSGDAVAAYDKASALGISDSKLEARLKQ